MRRKIEIPKDLEETWLKEAYELQKTWLEDSKSQPGTALTSDAAIQAETLRAAYIAGRKASYEESHNLKTILHHAKKTLEFYADPLTWSPGIAFSQNNLLHETDMYCVRGDHFYGGKKAKLFLEDFRNQTDPS